MVVKASAAAVVLILFTCPLMALSEPDSSIDGFGQLQNVTVLMTYSVHLSENESYSEHMRLHFSPYAVCSFVYDDEQRDFFETDIKTLPTLVDYAMHGTKRCDYYLSPPDGQQVFSLGGGANQLDIYKNYKPFADPEFLLHAGVGLNMTARILLKKTVGLGR